MNHHRHSIRLPGFDYRNAGAYFVTICTHPRERLFGEITNKEMYLYEMGKTIEHVWKKLPERFPHIAPDEFVIMPNHFHGIVWIIVGAPLAGALSVVPSVVSSVVQSVTPSDQIDLTSLRDGAGTRPAPTPIGDVIGAFKSLTTNAYICHQRTMDPSQVVPKLWQRNYYEHIIRDERSLFAIRQYIRDNPGNWETDPERK